ncbi:MAG: lysophospholipid acyltransferase family protein [Pirellulales bacterium]|nr:lysophospholipid acyltransferase family protein [Pirellulales bacterium]
MIDLAAYFFVRIGICILQALSIETCQQVSRGLAWLMADVLRVRRRVVDENLAQAFPEWSPERRRRVARQMWEHLFLLVAEVAHLPRKVHDTNWREFIHMVDGDTVARLLLTDRPRMLVTAHFGNFEFLGYVFGLLGFPSYAIARPLDNPYLDRFVTQFRGATGQFMIPKKGNYEQILRVLTSGNTLGFLGDQHAGSKGCWVEFFGRLASTHKAIALLALEHRATVLVGAARRMGRPMRYEFRLEGHLDTREDVAATAGMRPLTQWYTAQLERMIRRSPEQYWWLHRRWREPPVRAQKKRQAA